ncbi:MAG: hypothetical protein F7B95_00075 [Desulfurococcales archaeon]|nr:hypothetical protein [Desulfurococcales archaeon]
MHEIQAKLEGVEKRGNRYSARIKLTYEGKDYTLTLDNLMHEPASVEHRISGDYVLIELKSKEGKGFATCCIHKGHLEKGCMECPSLMTPPKEEGSKCS